MKEGRHVALENETKEKGRLELDDDAWNKIEAVFPVKTKRKKSKLKDTKMDTFRLFPFVVCFVSCFAVDGRSETIVVPATNFSAKDGNYVPAEKNWDHLGVLHGKTGSVTWPFEVTKSGRYHILCRYASGGSRPCTLRLEGSTLEKPVTVNRVLAESTGGFFAKNLQWSDLGTFSLEPGSYTMTLVVSNYMPHLHGFEIVPEAEVRRRAEEAEKRRWEGYDETTRQTRKKLRNLMSGVDSVVFVKRPTFQSTHYYTDFIDGSVHFGCELCRLSLKDGSVENLVPSLREGIIGRCNLSFDGKKVIFDYKRKLGEGYRIWEVGIDGENLRQLTFSPPDEAERIETYRMDKTYKHWAAPYHFTHHTDDMHPAYLPGGGFMFASTRCEHGILCDGPDYLVASVLYRADENGKLEKLSDNSVSESCPTVMEDGRVLYTRWEYVDNGSVTNKGLWAINPDGTASSEIYGANIAFPSVFNAARQIPGCATKFVCVGAPHMPLGVGTVLVVDTLPNRRTVDGVRYVTAEVDQQHQSGWQKPAGKPFALLFEHDSVRNLCLQNDYSRDGHGNTDRGPLFMDPFPISEHKFLVSYNPDEKWSTVNAYGLYLIDDKGNRELLFRDKNWSAWSPVPVRSVPEPAVPMAVRDAELVDQNLARLLVVDVYAGMDGVERGTVKYLRVNEHVPRPWSARRRWDGDTYDQQHSVVSMKTHLGLKVQHGVVPVEADGSANFLVPADKNIFLQALDENFREVQRERTFVNFRPGEVRSCVGCHERASETPTVGSRTVPIAMRRNSDHPGPQPGEIFGARPISYIHDVQPVLDRHCVKCHNSKQTDGEIDLEGKLTDLFNRSYETLMKWNSFPVVGENHPKAGNNHYLPPYSLGSHASRLVKLLDAGHYDVKMPQEDWIRLTTWIDSNGQYYGSYFGRKHLKHREHPDFRPDPTFEETQKGRPSHP